MHGAVCVDSEEREHETKGKGLYCNHGNHVENNHGEQSNWGWGGEEWVDMDL